MLLVALFLGVASAPRSGATVYHSNGSEPNVQSLLRVESDGDTITLPAGTFTSSSIASRYPGDKNIASDPAVIFADDFESYTSVDQIKTKWGNGSWWTRMRIATEPANVFSGHKSVEFTLPISLTEVGCSLSKILNPEQDTVYIRMYHKFDSGFYLPGSSHNGISLSAKYPGTAGIRPPPDGTGFFLFALQNDIIGSQSSPGFSNLYVYWPRQRTQFGDHWFPDGTVIPYSPVIGNKGEWLAYPNQYPDFRIMPNFLPQRDRWYCVELMVHANTPGRNDGEVKYWIDGQLAGDFPDLNVRSISTLKLDRASLGLYAQHSERINKKWYDNVVIATQYIGPMVSPTPTPTPHRHPRRHPLAHLHPQPPAHRHLHPRAHLHPHPPAHRHLHPRAHLHLHPQRPAHRHPHLNLVGGRL